MKNDRHIAAKVALLLASCVLSFVIAETIAGRLDGPVLDVGDLPKESFAAGGNFTPPLSSYGHREEEPHEALLEPGTKRILLLGDSFTFGDGVPRGSDRFSDLLEARLNREFGEGADATRYHVYNAGVSGSYPVQWYSTLMRLLPVYRPDHVLSIFFLRDGTGLCTSLRCYGEEIDTLRSAYETRWAYRHTNLGRLLYERRVATEFKTRYRQQVVDSYLGNYEQRRHWQSAQFALMQIDKRCQANGISHDLVIFPMLFELDAYPYREVENEIARFATENGIPSFSLLGGFEGRDAGELWVAPNDQHPNEMGHAIAAETLYPDVVRILRRPRKR